MDGPLEQANVWRTRIRTDVKSDVLSVDDVFDVSDVVLSVVFDVIDVSGVVLGVVMTRRTENRTLSTFGRRF